MPEGVIYEPDHQTLGDTEREKERERARRQICETPGRNTGYQRLVLQPVENNVKVAARTGGRRWDIRTTWTLGLGVTCMSLT